MAAGGGGGGGVSLRFGSSALSAARARDAALSSRGGGASETPANTAAASTKEGVRWWRLRLTTCGGESSAASDCAARPSTVAASLMRASTPSSTGMVSTAFGDSSERLRLRRPASQIAEAMASTRAWVGGSMSMVLVVSRAGCPLSWRCPLRPKVSARGQLTKEATPLQFHALVRVTARVRSRLRR